MTALPQPFHFGAGEAAALRQSLALGLAATPPPDAALPALSQLALLAAWQRCARPAPPSFLPPTETQHASLRLLPDASRRQLARLLAMKKKESGDCITLAALLAVRGAGFELHPFDFARMEDALARHADILGAAPRHWLQAVRPEKALPEAAYDQPPVDEDNLAAASKGPKLDFLRSLRAESPDKARALIESLFPNEPAALRLDLLGLIANRLSDADRPFLESLAVDRAQSVREKAEALLSSLPGTDAFVRRIARLREDFQIKTEGLLRRRKVLVYRAPANVKSHEVAAAQRASLSGLRLDDIAAAFGETAENLTAIAGVSDKAGDMGFILLLKAAEEGILHIVEANAGLMEGDDGRKAVELLQAGLPNASGPARERLIQLALPENTWRSFSNEAALAEIFGVLGGPLPAPPAQNLLASNAWTKMDPAQLEAAAEAAAPLIPASLSANFIARFAAASPRSAQFHTFLLTLNAPAA